MALNHQYTHLNCKWSTSGSAEQEAKHQEIASHNNNPIVQAIQILINNESPCWQGTAKEMLDECKKQIKSFPKIRENELAKGLKSLRRKLFDYNGIDYTPPPTNGSNGKRLHNFRIVEAVSINDDQNNQDFDIVDFDDTP